MTLNEFEIEYELDLHNAGLKWHQIEAVYEMYVDNPNTFDIGVSIQYIKHNLY